MSFFKESWFRLAIILLVSVGLMLWGFNLYIKATDHNLTVFNEEINTCNKQFAKDDILICMKIFDKYSISPQFFVNKTALSDAKREQFYWKCRDENKNNLPINSEDLSRECAKNADNYINEQ
jgi:hypothetical protein